MAKKGSKKPGGLRCLSIRQPWAWLVCIGAKSIENRTWTTQYRGTIAIHASTSKTMLSRAERNSPSGFIKTADFRFGAIIGVADIEEIHVYGREHESLGHASGPFCWKMTNGRLLKVPIPMMGKLSLFSLDEATTKAVMDSEFEKVDFQSDQRLRTIVSEFEPNPDPYSGYCFAIDELCEKANPEELLAMANRMVELRPNELEPYNYRLAMARKLDDENLMKSDLDRMAELLDKIFGNGERDQEILEAKDRWLCEASQDNDVEADHDSSEESDEAEDQDQDQDEDQDQDDPESWHAELAFQLQLLIENYSALGIYELAHRHAQRLAAVDPTNVEGRIWHGVTLMEGIQKYDQAIDELQTSLKLLNDEKHYQNEEQKRELQAIALLELAKAYRLSNALPLAKETINGLLKERPDGAFELLEAALIAEAMQDKQTAKQLAKKALSLDDQLDAASELLKRL